MRTRPRRPHRVKQRASGLEETRLRETCLNFIRFLVVLRAIATRAHYSSLCQDLRPAKYTYPYLATTAQQYSPKMIKLLPYPGFHTMYSLGILSTYSTLSDLRFRCPRATLRQFLQANASNRARSHFLTVAQRSI